MHNYQLQKITKFLGKKKTKKEVENKGIKRKKGADVRHP
jgi:hypothetical protein